MAPDHDTHIIQRSIRRQPPRRRPAPTRARRARTVRDIGANIVATAITDQTDLGAATIRVRAALREFVARLAEEAGRVPRGIGAAVAIGAGAAVLVGGADAAGAGGGGGGAGGHGGVGDGVGGGDGGGGGRVEDGEDVVALDAVDGDDEGVVEVEDGADAVGDVGGADAGDDELEEGEAADGGADDGRVQHRRDARRHFREHALAQDEGDEGRGRAPVGDGAEEAAGDGVERALDRRFARGFDGVDVREGAGAGVDADAEAADGARRVAGLDLRRGGAVRVAALVEVGDVDFERGGVAALHGARRAGPEPGRRRSGAAEHGDEVCDRDDEFRTAVGRVQVDPGGVDDDGVAVREGEGDLRRVRDVEDDEGPVYGEPDLVCEGAVGVEVGGVGGQVWVSGVGDDDRLE